jgi:hypothetical protein
LNVRIIAGLVVVLMLLPAGAFAQAGVSAVRSQPIRDSIARVDASTVALTERSVLLFQATGGRQRSVGRKIAGGAIGGVAGFFAGGVLGAKIDGDCGGCDDPGFKGALIGAPIGAVVGAILGVKFF